MSPSSAISRTRPRRPTGLVVGLLLAVLSVGTAAVGAASAATGSVRLVSPALSSDAGAGRLLWARCPQGECVLYTRYQGVTSRLPIASFGLQEDAEQASLGVGPDGHQLAAYDRCGPSLHNCGLYVFDFTTGVEQRLPVSNHGGAFTTPTVSGDKVAYAYNSRGRDGPNRTYAIYWSYLDGTRMYRVHTEPMDAQRDPPMLALSGDLLAYEGDSRLTSCLDQTHVRIATLGTNSDRLIATGTSSTDVFSPQWDGQTLYYGRDIFTVANYRHDFTRKGIIASRIERYSLKTGRTSATPYMHLAIAGVMSDGAGLFYQLVTAHFDTSGLYAADPPPFHRIVPHRRLSRV